MTSVMTPKAIRQIVDINQLIEMGYRSLYFVIGFVILIARH